MERLDETFETYGDFSEVKRDVDNLKVIYQRMNNTFFTGSGTLDKETCDAILGSESLREISDLIIGMCAFRSSFGKMTARIVGYLQDSLGSIRIHEDMGNIRGE